MLRPTKMSHNKLIFSKLKACLHFACCYGPAPMPQQKNERTWQWKIKLRYYKINKKANWKMSVHQWCWCVWERDNGETARCWEPKLKENQNWQRVCYHQNVLEGFYPGSQSRCARSAVYPSWTLPWVVWRHPYSQSCHSHCSADPIKQGCHSVLKAAYKKEDIFELLLRHYFTRILIC